MVDAGDLLPRTPAQRAERAQEHRLERYFLGRRWRVMTEKTNHDLKDGPARCIIDQGEVWVTGGSFSTPTGHRGRHGFMVAEVDPVTGADLDPQVRAIFGRSALIKAQSLYSAISGDIPAERSHPPRSA